MRALVFNKNRRLEMQDVPVPEITRDDQVLMKVKYTGICGTDIHILSGHYNAKHGIILGHESSGVVEKVGAEVKNLKPGDGVILDPTYHCNNCFYCQTDRPNYCAEKGTTETGVSANGTFAEYHVAKSSFLYPLPKGMSFEEATLSEPLACVLNALDQTRIKPHSRVLVTGAGPIGLLFGIASSSLGCEVTMGDVSKYRIEHAKSLFEEVQDYSKESLLNVNSKRRFDIAIDTSGKLLEEMVGLVDKGGDLLTAGLDYSTEAKIKPAYLTDNGIRLIGSIDSNLTFAPAIKMIEKNKNFRKIITHSYPLECFGKAFNLLGLNVREPSKREEIRAGKVVICPN